ncbi:putative C2 domain [Monocercomonoides exilis]|uniref:putative C2 domain n=1 Tax=Monocercomonoides exilis TaxID=2049356 RepID=UPI003559D822|nr:putative C2 domain [Monocercomonoides exilis]|eukprot:MONOS_3177.1-p1 / transcript=MONOS_3177.1 / gene=MONOS_3177 / organism=Monocercomonoides_exilis_PA203 / gene_product=unspecified product / transcript_product=unspecified product / location=Mono_scaffold00072:119842-121291(-) / protein_length=426 / sequence_SO=supercontig / SO=protein_coding / is_pseudo=false
MGGSHSKVKELGTKLYITVFKATKLKPGFYRKPYVKISVGRKEICTSFGQGVNPMFMERFCFEYDASDGDAIVQVWDSGMCFTNEFLGEIKFPLEPFLRSEKRRTFKLFHDKNPNPGNIDLSVFLCPAGYVLDRKENRLSSVTEGIVRPPRPLMSPSSATTPSLPYYCRIDYPAPEKIISTPSYFGLFLVNKRQDARIREKQDMDKLKSAILELYRQKEQIDPDNIELMSQAEMRLEMTLAHAQLAADVSFLDLNETEEEALENLKHRVEIETSRYKKKIQELEQERLDKIEKERLKKEKKAKKLQKKLELERLRMELAEKAERKRLEKQNKERGEEIELEKIEEGNEDNEEDSPEEEETVGTPAEAHGQNANEREETNNEESNTRDASIHDEDNEFIRPQSNQGANEGNSNANHNMSNMLQESTL